MKTFRPYRPARTSQGIVKELILKLVIILIVLILVQLNACVAEARSLDYEISQAFFGYSVLMRKGLARRKKHEQQAFASSELEKQQKKRQPKHSDDKSVVEDTKRSGLGVG